MKERQRRLSSPAAKARRRASAVSFRRLSGTRALSVMRAAFPSLVDGKITHAPSLGAGGKLKRYVGDSAAVIADASGHSALVTSSTPLTAVDAKGRTRPVDLSLVRKGSVYTPANSPSPVRLPSRLRRGLRFERSGVSLSLRLPRNPRARRVSGRLFYANAARDTDVLVEPRESGAELFTQLRSAASPSEQAYVLSLPDGAVAALAADGSGVDIRRAGKQIAQISAPVAWDADRTRVPTSYRLTGNVLVVTAHHTRGSYHYRYPITVDPYVIENNDFRSANANDASFQGWFGFQWHTGGNAMGMKQSGAGGRGLYVYVSPGWTIPANDYAAWTWKAPPNVNIFKAQSRASMVPFYGFFTMQRGIVDSGPAWASGNPWNDNGQVLTDSWATTCDVGNCDENAGVKQNEFWFLYSTPYNVTMGGTSDTYAYLSQVLLYLNDAYDPVINSVPTTETNAGWRRDGVQVPSFTVTAHDDGLGMKEVNLFGGGLSMQSKPQCLGSRTWRCPNDAPGGGWTPSFSYNTSQLPEGVTTLGVNARDITDRLSATYPWQVKVDKTGPAADFAGELDWARDEPRLTTDTPDLTVDATDTTEDGTPLSGVQRIEITFDGSDTDPANQVATQTCSVDGCGFDHTFHVNTAALGNGPHTIDVLLTDFAGNVSDHTWQFTIDRTSARPPCSDPNADPEGCQPQPPATTPATCTVGTPGPQAPTGSFVTADQAVAQTQTSMPSALAWSELATVEGLNVQPTATGGVGAIVNGYKSDATLIQSVLGGSAANYKVGSGTDSVCVTPATTVAGAPAPKQVNAAVVYADTAPSTDTILRPTVYGTQQISQIRDASAPEAVAYNVALRPGQYLSELSDGSIAVIDPTLPTASGAEPAYDMGTEVSQSNPSSTDDPDRDVITSASTYTDGDVADLRPDDSGVDPPKTQWQYENQDGMLRGAQDDADGQAVAVLTTPWALDATGADVPSEFTITGPSTVTLTTMHKSAAYSYPVMASSKTMASGPGAAGKPPRSFKYGLALPHPMDLYARQTGTDPEGVRKIRSALKIKSDRYIMTDPTACEPWVADPSVDLRTVSSSHCSEAAKYVEVATKAKLTPFITFQEDRNLSVGAYAAAVEHLWARPEFNQVKYWGATNEPDFQAYVKTDAVYAARIWKAIQNRATNKKGGVCAGCHIVAGEFSKDVRGKSSDKYVLDYMNALKKATPHDWGLHFYDDVGNAPVHKNKKTYKYVSLRRFLDNLNGKFKSKRPNVLLNEGGVALVGGHENTELSGNLGAQENAGYRFRRIGFESRQIKLVSYYAVFGSAKFDSAIVTPPGRPPDIIAADGTHRDNENLDGKNFRPSYCYLTNKFGSGKQHHVFDMCKHPN